MDNKKMDNKKMNDKYNLFLYNFEYNENYKKNSIQRFEEFKDYINWNMIAEYKLFSEDLIRKFKTNAD